MEELINNLEAEETAEVTEEPADAEAAEALPDTEEEAVEVTEEPGDADIEVTEEPADAEAAEALADTEEEAVEVTEEPGDADIEVTEEPADAEAAEALADTEEEAVEVTEEPKDADKPAKNKSTAGLVLGIVFGAIALILGAIVAVYFILSSLKSITLAPTMLTLAEGESAVVAMACDPIHSKLEQYVANAELSDEDAVTVPAMIEGALMSRHKFTWTSSDESVATVDSDGNVTAVAAGSCTVTVAAKNGVTASLPVTVAEPAAAEEQAIYGIWYSFAQEDIATQELTEFNNYALSIDQDTVCLLDMSTYGRYDFDWEYYETLENPVGNVFFCYMDGQAVLYIIHEITGDYLYLCNNEVYIIFYRGE